MSIEKAKLIQIVARSTNSQVAVIFVHGIGGDPHDTWRKDQQTKPLFELLGDEPLLSDVEFYSYGYRTGITPLQYDFMTIRAS
ncbi:hypothetical protein SAMN04487969_108182 [Paenibacillus algorifonticola]|uniref:Alpha/beta hydrolase family protein n=1 Tax=Paenibacillus algorifonticola TaxID=684063 RepID=A0A1I2E574_9BACL|nr:hypothetical protein [Paenibacillus algorifonticola]SFE87813.1 hypothetical protein SAMN04487969_108182 [Paenibacillus algorifonticola]